MSYDAKDFIPTSAEVLNCTNWKALLKLFDDYDIDSVPVDAWRSALSPSEFGKLYEHYISLLEAEV